MRKARATSIVQSGDIAGQITFHGYSGTDYPQLAEIRAIVDGTPGASSDMPGALSFFTTADGAGSVTERMKIDNAGLVTGTGTSLGAWTSFTSTLTASTTNPNIGSTGTSSGHYCRIGKTIFFRVTIVFAGTGISAGSGYYRIGIPVTASGSAGGVGSAWMYDASAGARQLGTLTLAATTYCEIILTGASGFPAVQDNSPWTWAADDTITVSGTYEAA
jgi:hypothetical protein